MSELEQLKLENDELKRKNVLLSSFAVTILQIE